ncbi:MAG: FAD:protein FMN transferase [Gammaproteobacteria bacterium]|nr:FAD:protein FMN transferase [Gammaproteobacteria bacterium]
MARLLQICLLLPTLLVGACERDTRLPEYELTGNVMGTTFNVLLVSPSEGVSKDRLQARIVETLEDVENLASTWREDSELSKFNANSASGWIATSGELCEAIARTLEVSRQSEGAFDITVGPLVNLWGFGPDGDVSEPPAEDVLAAVMAEVGYKGLQTRCDAPAVNKRSSGMYVDLSGWAKGHAVDELASLLDQHQLQNYLVEIGGEIKVRGHNAEGLKWAVAIETPSTTKRVPHSVLRVTNTSVATSGDYRNFFEHGGRHFSHTIDARTGRPVDHALAAVTVVNESAAYADAMATALLVLGPTDGPKRAEKLGIAAYFLIRHETGFDEVSTPNFELLRSG